MKLLNTKDMSRAKNWRICIYGKAGIGKTSTIKFLKGKTFVLDLDNSSKVLADPEREIEIGQINRTKPIEEINDFLQSLLPKISKEYDNLVIDNVSSFETDWFIERGRNSKSGINNEIQDYSTWKNYFLRVIGAIYQSDINILVTAWERQRDITAETGQSFTQFVPDLRDSVINNFMGLTDVVARMIVNPKTSERGFILDGNNAVFAKNRLDHRKACQASELFDIEDVDERKMETNTN